MTLFYDGSSIQSSNSENLYRNFRFDEKSNILKYDIQYLMTLFYDGSSIQS